MMVTSHDEDNGSLASRMMFLIGETTTPHKRFKELEDWTGIPSDSWRKFANGKQRPTSEMIERIGMRFPHYCQWLLTGSAQFRPQNKPSNDPHKTVDPGVVSTVVELVLKELSNRDEKP